MNCNIGLAHEVVRAVAIAAQATIGLEHEEGEMLPVVFGADPINFPEQGRDLLFVSPEIGACVCKKAIGHGAPVRMRAIWASSDVGGRVNKSVCRWCN